MNESVVEDLESAIRGEVMLQDEIRQLYSLDASAYQIVPDVVVVPTDEDDVVSAITIAKRTRTPITPRGAGTGLVGGALNTGIILDMKNFDTVNVDGSRAVVGVGVRKGRLDQILGRHGKIFAPNPSVGAFCSIGGMLGNNAGGSRSVKYGSTVDNVTKVRFVDGTGKTVTLPDDRQVGEKILKIAGSAQIEMFPQVTKNSSGYRLDKVRTIDETHRILVGSEGTLGIILSAELCLIDESAYKRLFVLRYDSLATAMSDCVRIVKTGPSALEFVDRHVIEKMNVEIGQDAECILLVEYDEHIRDDAEILKTFTGRITADLEDAAEIDWWWNHRNAALHYSMSAVPLQLRTPHIIDDAAVPLERINDLFCILDDINKKYKTSTITFGHAGDGNIHARLILDNMDTKILKRIASQYYVGINRLGGTITAEHGDGFVSSEFVRRQYGHLNYKAFQEVKQIFDPCNILNPDKKITSKSSIVENLLL